MKTNKKATGRRVLGILLCLVMVLTLLPIIALADDPEGEPEEGPTETVPTTTYEIPFTKTVTLGGNTAPGQGTENTKYERNSDQW